MASPFLSILSGLTAGAGKTYTDIAEQERQNKFKQNELTANALEKQLAEDPAVWANKNAYIGQVQQYYKTRGLKPAEIQQILPIHDQLWEHGHAPGVVDTHTPFGQKQAEIQSEQQRFEKQEEARRDNEFNSNTSMLVGLGRLTPEQAQAARVEYIKSKSQLKRLPDMPTPPAGVDAPKTESNTPIQSTSSATQNLPPLPFAPRPTYTETTTGLAGGRINYKESPAKAQAIPGRLTGRRIKEIEGPDARLWEGGPPVVDNEMYRGTQFPSVGKRIYDPTDPNETKQVLPDTNSITGASLAFFDPQGKEPHPEERVPAFPPGGFGTTSVSGTRQVPHDMYNPATGHIETVMLPEDYFAQRTRSAFGGATKPNPKVNPTPTGIPPTGPKVVGISSKEGARQQENQLPPAAQTQIASTNTTLDLIQRLKAAIAPNKDENTPWVNVSDNLLYRVGIATDKTKLISDLSIGRIIEGGRLVHPTGSRAMPLLQQAMIHTPNTHDSYKTMWDKLTQIEQNLNDYKNETFKEQQKFPGMPKLGPQATPPTPLTSTPTSGGVRKKWNPAKGVFE
jgi:hypothetical protein